MRMKARLLTATIGVGVVCPAGMVMVSVAETNAQIIVIVTVTGRIVNMGVRDGTCISSSRDRQRHADDRCEGKQQRQRHP